MSNKVRTYKVKGEWTFRGTIDVRATSKKDAVQIVKTGFNHPSIDVGSETTHDSPGEGHEGIVDWNIGLMAEREHIY